MLEVQFGLLLRLYKKNKIRESAKNNIQTNIKEEITNMTNGEVWKLCLDDKTAKLEELEKELAQLDIDYSKANFEEDMYARLKESSGSQYRPTFAKNIMKAWKMLMNLKRKNLKLI